MLSEVIMPHINVYIPEEVVKKARLLSQKNGKSLSSFLTDLLKERCEAKPRKWPKHFFTRIMGGWKGDFPEIEDPLPEKRESL
jgi:hypothetical protein